MITSLHLLTQFLLFSCIAGGLFLAPPSPARADIYQYTDGQGTVIMTDRLANVPKAQRRSVKVVREEPKPQPAMPAASTTGPATTPEQAQVQAIIDRKPSPPAPSRANFPIKLIFGITAAIAGLFVIRKLTGALSSPQLAKVIYVAFFLGVFVTGYKLYADHLVGGYFAIKQKMLTMFAKAQQREGLAPARPSSGKETDPQ